jgi:hypothetical protein
MPQDRALIALQSAYRAHGGVTLPRCFNAGVGDGSEVQRREVENLFAAGELFGFQWYGVMWIPMVQFALPGTTVSAGP